MEKQQKLSPVELAGLIIIALILLFLPYTMVTQHAQNVKANSYYHDGK